VFLNKTLTKVKLQEAMPRDTSKVYRILVDKSRKIVQLEEGNGDEWRARWISGYDSRTW
jgi:hypothetical protein